MIEAVLPPLQRWLLFSGVLLLGGAVAWRSFVAPWQPAALRDSMRELEGRVAGVASLVALLLLPVWGLRLWVQVQDFRDPFAPLTDDLRFLLLETFWGSVWFAQGAVLLLLAVLLHFLARRARRVLAGERRAREAGELREEVAGPAIALPAGWKAAWLGVIGAALTLSLSSHAMAVPYVRALAVGVDAAHLLAAGAWIGSLAFILTLTPRGREGVPVLAGQLRSFSYLAMGAVTVLLFMGTVLAGVHVGEIRNLWATEYGRVLSLKILTAGGVLYLGFRNWRHGLPVLDTEEGSRAVRRRAGTEVAVAALVVLLTAVLVGTSMPEGVH